MIKKIMKKAIKEMSNPNNRKTRNMLLSEMILVLLYFICMIVQHIKPEINQILYMARWIIILVAGVLLWRYESKEKQSL